MFISMYKDQLDAGITEKGHGYLADGVYFAPTLQELEQILRDDYCDLEDYVIAEIKDMAVVDTSVTTYKPYTLPKTKTQRKSR